MDATVYFVGTAGAGKSTLVAAFDRWAKKSGLSTLLVNLDPGAEKLPYEPDIDIRETVRLSDIMEEHGLGPNGAQVAAADMIALDLTDTEEEIGSYRADITFIDTPGQVELFVFRAAGKHIVESIAPGKSVIVYLLDPFLARTASGFASQLMLAATTQFRFNEPMITVLSKADVLEEDVLETIQKWAADPEALETDVMRDEPSMNRELAALVARLLESMSHELMVIPTSAADGLGIEDLYVQIQSAVGESEDSTPEYDTFHGQGQEEGKEG